MADDFVVDNDLMISLIEQNSVLWDKTEELYKNRTATKAAWNEIIKVMDPHLETRDRTARQANARLMIQKWTYIRDNYFRTHKKIQFQKRLGNGTKISKPYVYSKKLKFLSKLIPPKELEENITDNSNTENDVDDNNSVTSEKPDINSKDNKENDTKNLTPKRMSKKSVKNEEVPVETKIKFMDAFLNNKHKEETNRHLSFFKGILPSLDDFDENDVLEFQMGVLKLLKNITRSRQNGEMLPMKIEYDDPLSDE